MYPLLAAIDAIARTYLQSLRKDLEKKGHEIILIVVVVSWVSLLILGGMLAFGWFHLPTDPMFYVYWFGVTFLATIHITLFLMGLSITNFLAANTFARLGFVVTTVYAIIFLGESITTLQTAAIVIATIGIFFFFEYRELTRAWIKNNKGLLYIIFSLLVSPFALILYKLSTQYTDSYQVFLTGRLAMDFVYYSFFFLILFWLYYKKNPKKSIIAIFSSRLGLVYMFGASLAYLLDSWLIFLLPVTVINIIGTIAIPTSYIIGKFKYKEIIQKHHFIGMALIVCAIVLFNLN